MALKTKKILIVGVFPHVGSESLRILKTSRMLQKSILLSKTVDCSIIPNSEGIGVEKTILNSGLIEGIIKNPTTLSKSYFSQNRKSRRKEKQKRKQYLKKLH